MFKPASWIVEGVVAEVRPLGKRADKNDIWAHSVKIAALGGTYEAQTKDSKLANKLGSGVMCRANGTFESYNGSIRLILTDLVEIDQSGNVAGTPAAPRPAGKAA